MKRLGIKQVQVLLVLTAAPQTRLELVDRVRARGWAMDLERLEWTLDSLIVRGLAACTDLHTYTLGDSPELPEALAYAQEFVRVAALAQADAVQRAQA